MRIIITGSSGFIGKHLISHLKGDEIFCPTRTLFSEQPQDLSPFEHQDAYIHLCGENISAGRWTEERKKKLIESRIQTTQFLTRLFSRLSHPPKQFICASAIGFYGDQQDTVLNEKYPKGNGFLADLCYKWEGAANQARHLGIGVVNTRFAMVLGSDGGGLQKMLTPFKLFLGGNLGSGEQYLSWIHIDDLCSAICFILNNLCIEGPVNLSSPQAVRQKEFASTLAKILHRPSFFTLPAPLLKLFLGEMAQEVLLSSIRAYPEVLLQNGFSFEYPTLPEALKTLLGGRGGPTRR